MKRVILSAVIAVGTFQLILVAQEPDPEPDPAAESAAPESFQVALKVAHSEHIANLEAALAQALAEDELDEAIHIRRSISMEKLRARVTDTSWTWNRPDDPNTIHFRDGRFVTTGKGAGGVWEVLEDKTVIVKFGADLFMFRFNEDFESYRVNAYSPARTLFRNGRKVRGE